MNQKRKMRGVAVGLMMLAAGALPTHADWVPTTGGTYDYGAAANWAGGVSNNVFLPSTYNGTAQTITLASDGVWNPNAAVVTAHTNVTTLLLRATGSDRNLVLGGGSPIKALLELERKTTNSSSARSAQTRRSTLRYPKP